MKMKTSTTMWIITGLAIGHTSPQTRACTWAPANKGCGRQWPAKVPCRVERISERWILRVMPSPRLRTRLVPITLSHHAAPPGPEGVPRTRAVRRVARLCVMSERHGIPRHPTVSYIAPAYARRLRSTLGMPLASVHPGFGPGILKHSTSKHAMNGVVRPR